MIIAVSFSLIAFAISAGAFLRIREDVAELKYEKNQQIDLIEKFMKKIITHDEMKKYIEEAKEEGKIIASLKENYQKEKWKNLKQAFSGKREEE